MKRLFAVMGIPISLAACVTDNCPPPGVEHKIVTVTKETLVPCRVTIPHRPGAVIVKKGDDANAVALRYKAVLEQWGGEGESYANLAEAALRACMRGGKE